MQTLVASKVNEDFGETVPSRLHNVGLQVPHNVAPMSGSEKEHLNDSVDAAGEGIYAKTSSLYQIQTFFCEMHGYYVVFFRNILTLSQNVCSFFIIVNKNRTINRGNRRIR